MDYRGLGKGGNVGGKLLTLKSFLKTIEICCFRCFCVCACMCVCVCKMESSWNGDSAPTRHVKQPSKDIIHQVE